jgi:phosphate transport system substrate-binding protein
MKTKLLVTGLASALALWGCKKSDEAKPAEPGKEAPVAAEGAKDTGLIKADGSSTVFPISEAVAEEYQKGAKSKVTVGTSGTGGGFKKFCSGEIDVADASRAIKKAEMEACAKNGVEYIELPIAYDGLAIMIHPKNDWAATMTVAELKKLWEPEAQGKVTKWSQVREGWPDKEIHLFGAGTDSGTFDYFTEAVVGKSKASRGDYTSSEDDNVLVQGISKDELALGYFGLAYYSENKDKLKLVAIDDGKDDNGKGPIEPTTTTVADGTYQPLSRPLFIYVAKKSLERPEVAAFADFYVKNAAALGAEVGYIALPAKAYELAAKRLATKKVGSMFGGEEKPGMKIEDLLAKEGE